MLNLTIRVIALVIFLIQFMYWHREEKYADHVKPKTRTSAHVGKYMNAAFKSLILLQLVGFSLYPIQQAHVLWQLSGIVVMGAGLMICLVARREIGTNWANGYEYQIKERQSLVRTGIYSLIRHPIYLGLTLLYVGGELAAGSWLWIGYLAFFLGFYVQGKREERILAAHFGKPYEEYMRHTKMLIPYIV